MLTGVLTADLRGVDRLGEDVSGGSLGRADHMGVDPKRDCGVSVAQPGGDDMNGDAREQQGRRVQVPIMRNSS